MPHALWVIWDGGMGIKPICGKTCPLISPFVSICECGKKGMYESKRQRRSKSVRRGQRREGRGDREGKQRRVTKSEEEEEEDKKKMGLCGRRGHGSMLAMIRPMDMYAYSTDKGRAWSRDIKQITKSPFWRCVYLWRCIFLCTKQPTTVSTHICTRYHGADSVGSKEENPFLWTVCCYCPGLDVQESLCFVASWQQGQRTNRNKTKKEGN